MKKSRIVSKTKHYSDSLINDYCLNEAKRFSVEQTSFGTVDGTIYIGSKYELIQSLGNFSSKANLCIRAVAYPDLEIYAWNTDGTLDHWGLKDYLEQNAYIPKNYLKYYQYLLGTYDDSSCDLFWQQAELTVDYSFGRMTVASFPESNWKKFTGANHAIGAIGNVDFEFIKAVGTINKINFVVIDQINDECHQDDTITDIISVDENLNFIGVNLASSNIGITNENKMKNVNLTQVAIDNKVWKK